METALLSSAATSESLTDGSEHPPKEPLTGELELAGIREARKRFFDLNAARIARARSVLSPQHRDFLDILPLLLDANHPLMPGFVGMDAPVGVAGYSPSDEALRAARRLSRSFEFKRRAKQTVDILGIYLMGSGGSVAYSRTSDFDIWVCHRADLTPDEIAALERKTDAITQWALSLSLEVHFFNLDADAFRRGQAEALSAESSGSAQHYLLLDEFYRTALLLAGRYPIWWLVPPAEEARYHAVVQDLCTRRIVSSSDFLDFGTVSELPAAEFVGAALWQLTKAIGSPYKSLLKIMLLEAYASEFPDPDFLSGRFKRAVYDGETSLDAFDPYVVFTQKVEDYLLACGDADRLELARQCFYFKVNIPLSRASMVKPDDWRSRIVANVVSRWDWSPSTLARLDGHSGRKIDDVISERRVVVRALIHTYKFISRFSREQAADNRVSDKDLTILGRKLFAAFEHKAGKIDIVARDQASSLAESHLVVVQNVSDDGRNAWAVSRHPGPNEPLPAPFKRSETLLSLIAWCYFNGVLTPQTRVTMHSAIEQVSTRDIEVLEAHLRQHYPRSWIATPDVEDLTRAPWLLASSTFINLGVDPMESYTRQGKRLTSSHVDALSFGGRRENLIHEIQYLVLNSWREVVALDFKGTEGLLGCLCEHLRWLETTRSAAHQDQSADPSAVPSSCFTPGYSHAITSRMTSLFGEVSRWFIAKRAKGANVYVLKAADKYYALVAGQSQVTSQALGNFQGLIRYLSQPRESYAGVTIDSFALTETPLPAIYAHMSPGTLNCCYLARGKTAEIFITDENGALFYDRAAFYSEETLVGHLTAFFQSVEYRQRSQASSPSTVVPGVVFHRLVRGPGRSFRLQPVTTDASSRPTRGFEVQAIGRRVRGEVLFTLYCDGLEFNPAEYGHGVFTKVAEHIVSRRASEGRYPIFITDVDLSQLRYEPDAGPGLQTIHYLLYKRRIEEQLNGAIPKIANIARPR